MVVRAVLDDETVEILDGIKDDYEYRSYRAAIKHLAREQGYDV